MTAIPDWPGLLKWTMKHSDGTTSSDFTSMSEEKRKFLEEALNSMVNDEPARMREILTKLQASITKISDSEKSIQLLEELQDITSQIDMSLVFCHHLHGLSYLTAYLADFFAAPNAELIAVTKEVLSVVAVLSQNNIEVQQLASNLQLTWNADEHGSLLKFLLWTLSFSVEQSNYCPLVSKIMYAISGICMSNPFVFPYLLESENPSPLFQIMRLSIASNQAAAIRRYVNVPYSLYSFNNL